MDTLAVELVISDEKATVKLDNFGQKIKLVNSDINALGGQTSFAGPVTRDLTELSKRADAAHKTFQDIAKTRLDAGNVGALTREIIGAQQKSRTLAQDIVNIRKELANPNRSSSIAFLTTELKAAERELDNLNRKLRTVRTSPPAAVGNGQGGGSFGDAFGSRVLPAALSGGTTGAVIGGLAGGAAVVGISAATSLVSSLVGEIKELSVESVKLAANFEETTNAVAVFAGGTDNARRELALLDAVALDTPGLRLEAAEKGFQRLRALNFEAKLSRDLIKGLGTQRVLSGADNGAVERVITNLTQLSSGAGTAADVRQTIQNLPSLRPVFQSAFGTADFGKINELAKTNPEAFLKKFAEELSKAQTAQAGLNISIEKGSDALIQAGRILGEPLLDPLTKDVQDLTKYLRENESTIAKWGQSTADVLRGVSDTARLFSGQEGRIGKFARVSLALGSYGISELAIQNVQAFGNFGKLQREKEELENRPKVFAENLTKGIDFNGAKFKLDPLTNTLRQVSDQIAKTPSLADKIKSDEADKTAKELKKTLAELSVLPIKFALDDVSQNLEINKAKALRDSKGDVLKLARATADLEISALREQIVLSNKLSAAKTQNLSSEDFKSGKGLLIAEENAANTDKLNNQILLTRINLQKQQNDEIEKGKTKVRELGKTYESFLELLAARAGVANPFVAVFSEADKSLRDLRENLRGLSPELQVIAEKLQQKINSDSLFNAKLDNDFAAFDLRARGDELRDFKQPKIEDPSKFFNDFIEAGLKQISALNGGGTTFNLTGGGAATQGFSQSGSDPFTRFNSNIFADKTGKQFTNGFSQSDARNDLFFNFDRVEGGLGGFNRRQKSFADLTENEKNDFINKDNFNLQEKLARSFSLAENRTALSDEQQAGVDRKILALSSSVRPEQLSESQRSLVAAAAEKEAARRDGYEQKAQTQRAELIAIQNKTLDELAKLRAIAEKEGFKGIENIVRIIDDSNSKIELKPAATSSDTTRAYTGGTFYDEYEKR